MEADEREEVASSGRISRRRMLKRIGAGAAVAWSAPVLSTIRTPAYAQVQPSPICTRCDEVCPQVPCGPSCGCVRTTEGTCFCHRFISCTDIQTCDSSAQCPAGWACAVTCCFDGQRTVCVPPCGPTPQSVPAGQTTGG